MKYDREWLKRVNETKQIIPTIQELIPKIPEIRDRRTIKDQLHAAVERFGEDLLDGSDLSPAEAEIRQLGELAKQLVGAE